MSSYIAAIFLLLFLLLAIVVPLVLPTAVNAAVSIFAARKITKRQVLRIVILLAISALLSFNVRIPTMIADGFGPGKPPQIKVAKKTMIGPEDKLTLDLDSEVIYYRQTSEVFRWGIQNDWQLRLAPVAVIEEKPAWILHSLGIATTPGSDGRAVLRLRSNLRNDGIVEVSAQIINNGEIAATYRHEPRRNYLFEEISIYGRPRDELASYLLFLTQSTPWNISRDLFPRGYSPFKEFLASAVGQYGLSDSGAPVKPVLEPLNDPAKLIQGTARLVFEDPLSKLSIPPLHWGCAGEDAGHEYFVAPSQGITWQDKEIPALKMPIVTIEGFYPSPHTAVCSGNHFWMAAYHMKRLYVWHYIVDFRGRSLRLQEWVRADLPESAQAVTGKWSRKGIHLIKAGKDTFELFFVHYDEDTGRGTTAKEGFEIEMKLPVRQAKRSRMSAAKTK